jgi:methanogenic corrinoid protein MtbC1
MSEQFARPFEAALLAMDRVAANRILADAVRDRAAYSAIDTIVVPALEHLGEGWNQGRVSLAQVYMGGRICQDAVEAILPPSAPASGRPCAVVTLEDSHALGKRIVISALRASGIHVLDYGRQTVEEVVPRIAEDGLSILFVSVLMLPSALRVRSLMASVRERQLPVRVVVGGAPFRLDPELWREVGADAMGFSASDAVRIALELERAAA